MSQPALVLQKVRKSYPGFLLRDIELELPEGGVLGVIGANGAGKSTLLRILLGLVRQDSGRVEVLGKPMPAEEARVKLEAGYVAQEMSLYPEATLRWHMRWIASVYPSWDERQARRLVERLRLKPEQRFAMMSRGQQVKTMLLLAMARRPRLLVLDEPTAGLDPIARHEFLAEMMHALREQARSVVLSSHSTADVERVSDHILILHEGRMVEFAEKEALLERWRRIRFEADPQWRPERALPWSRVTRAGRLGEIRTGAFEWSLPERLEAAGARLLDVQRMTLEEIFLTQITLDGGGSEP
jgi:ABC-2 type transport system ATP-binding protein